MDIQRSLSVVKEISGYENMATHGIVAIKGIIPHGTTPN
jgi:hypothetical protein